MANKNIKKDKVSNKKSVSPKKTVAKVKKKDQGKKITNNLSNNKIYKEAEKLYKDKKYDEASALYIELLDIFKKNKKIYKRLIECLTKDFTYKDNSKEFKKLYNDYVSTYRILCTKKELVIIDNIIEEYKSVRISTGKSKFFLISLLGIFGVHKFIEKKYVLGFVYLFTLGLFGVGVILDLINDYALYEDDKQLDIIRYAISLFIICFGILNNDLSNYFCFILVGILFMPIVYSVLLRIIPGLIKFIAMIVLICFGFKVAPVITYIPTTAIGNWVTSNENTNLKEINVKLDSSTVKFSDRKDQKGNNEFDSKNNILIVKINDSTYYKFLLKLDENKICVYTESGECKVEFERKK